MATIKFFVQSKNNPAGIYVRLRDGVNVDAKAKTKFIINPKDWIFPEKSDEKGEKKKNSGGKIKSLKDESLKSLNQQMEEFKLKVLKQYNSDIEKMPIDSQWLKDFINPPIKNEIPIKLLEYFDYYALHKKSSMENSSYKKLQVNKNLLNRFQKAVNKEYSIKDINAEFKLKFETYCLSDNYAPNTIARAIRFIKTICRHAKANGIETHYQLDGITSNFVKVDSISLTLAEFDNIEKTKFEHDYLDNARDWLLISYETGQRVSDFLKFDKNMIRYKNHPKIPEKVVPFIDFTQIKTKKPISLPLSSRVIKILEKRGGEFPRKISDQRYNEYIKEVCRLSGLTYKILGSKKVETEPGSGVFRKVTGTFEKWELVSSHIGRRSKATNFFGIIPTSLLKDITGHSTEAQLLSYVGKRDEQKAMQLVDYFI